ncbi:MAG TPA: FkbM family methyltransferase [Chthoniobacteraceae bacterium]|nr:FkbM family methyltransferase [Chthoniobacteraceae bacterium]
MNRFDLLGYFLRIAPAFKGRGRLIRHWAGRARNERRVRVLPGGMKIECDMSAPYESMVWLGKEEDVDLAALRRVLGEGETFVDCGANIGLWTLSAAAATGPHGKVFAFEPNPLVFEKLSRNVHANGLENTVLALCAACGRERGMQPFCCSDEHNNSRMATALDKDVLFVPVRTLDEAVYAGRVHGIKVDVEGHELEVLMGGREILRRSRPWLCVEFNSSIAGVARLRDWKTHRFLRDIGYSCCAMADAGGDARGAALGDDWELQGYRNLFYFLRE